MFENLSKRLTESLDKLRRKGRLSEADVDAALREVRMALLEADVALPVARDFIAKLKEKAVGTDIITSVSPAQMVIKLVYDALVELLGGENTAELNLNAAPPAVEVLHAIFEPFHFGLRRSSSVFGTSAPFTMSVLMAGVWK